jgi:hypothetical protein
MNAECRHCADPAGQAFIETAGETSDLPSPGRSDGIELGKSGGVELEVNGVPGIRASVVNLHSGRVGPPEVQGAGRGGVGVQAHHCVPARTEGPLGGGSNQRAARPAAPPFPHDPHPRQLAGLLRCVAATQPRRRGWAGRTARLDGGGPGERPAGVISPTSVAI